MDLKKTGTNNLILFGFFLALFFLNYYTRTITYGPYSIHQWRQADCLSITKNYYEEGMHFFQPKIHYQGPVDGKAVSEFPIMNYTVAFLWKIFGQHEFIYRLLEYLIFLTAMFMLYNTLIRIYRSVLMAFFAVSFIVTSPLITYYSLNFIVDVPAFSIGIMSLCCTLRFYHTKKMRSFYWALALGTLAVLMKASALMGLSVLLFCSAVDVFNLNRFFGVEKLFSKKIVPCVLVIVSVGLIVSWYLYALIYNSYNSNNIFLLTVLPVWNMERTEIIYNLKILFDRLFPVFLNKPMFFLFLSLAIFVAANFRQLNALLKTALVFGSIFFVGYLLFFFQVFGAHDYYLINVMVFPAITLICLVHIVYHRGYLERNKRFAIGFISCLALFNAFHAAAIYRLRMVEKDNLTEWFPFISEEDLRLADYLSWDYSIGIKRIVNIEPELRRHGIKRDDFVLSYPDQSFDVSLYLMDQKGFTIARQHAVEDSTVADRFFTKNIKYVVMCDTVLMEQRSFRRIENKLEPFFVYNEVKVFKVKR